MFFSGVPAWRSVNSGGQAMVKPQLAARNGASGTSSQRAQAPSEPSRAPAGAAQSQDGRIGTDQMVATGRIPEAQGPRRWWKPSQRRRVSSRTPARPSRASQARSKGDAFSPVGNTRPLEPTNVSMPRSAPPSGAARPAGKTRVEHRPQRAGRRPIARDEALRTARYG